MQIKIYSTTTCPFCKMEKQFLDSKGIKYENAFVDEDEQARNEVVKLEGGTGVPFTVITKEDGTKVNILGFDKNKIEQTLAS